MKKFLNNLWKDESAQGATEYILLLVAVVALVMVFKDQITSQVRGLMDNLSAQINQISQ